jgi:hypothetical protein
LRHKGLDGVGAQDLGRQVHLPKAHALNGDGGHVGQQGWWKKQAKQDQLQAATPAAAPVTPWASSFRSMRHTPINTRRLRDSCHTGLCGVAMTFEHVMILQLV